MKKLIDYLLSPVYLLYFGLVLLVFHMAQVVAHRLGGRAAQKKVADLLNAFITYGWRLTGSSFRFQYDAPLPTNRPLLFVANHQSLFDISPLIWFLRRQNPVFVAKIELSRGIPSISYNLRRSGAALIDRKDARQAMGQLSRLGQQLNKRHCSVVIFPEGTRSASNVPNEFAGAGLAILLRKAPDALVVPIAIANTGKFNPRGLFPLRSFTRMSWTVLSPIDPTDASIEHVVERARTAIAEKLRAESVELRA
ncbi:lysophospholipid acyltransferase family protein [Fibrella aquatilis]|uniref:1-acyl-sn-glycerol-3-phosphate acyltransferase n=1 Tax=Fibrella aquatilis TaxID=2817059 RepID=A0A939G1G3_9BACT|nr:lysophospholipid acyltransferase family protein [Fibrella aquatilis]MBO0930121.1 1-acyl-sn-glycerol-3-phosphate acyltransferase [Fibrella aquatilis]